MRYKIAVSGSAMNNCKTGAFKKAWEIGYQIAKQGAGLVTGATIGIPEWSTRGAKAAGGVSIGVSPAASMREHVSKYHLPTRNLDFIMFSGQGYSGRDLLLIQSADAVIEICGRIGTLNEFSVAFESKRPIGVLLGTGGAADQIPEIIKAAKRGDKHVIYDTDPERLIKRVLKAVKHQHKDLERAHRKIQDPKFTNTISPD